MNRKCSWCGKMLTVDTESTAVTHTMCEDCAAREKKYIDIWFKIQKMMERKDEPDESN